MAEAQQQDQYAGAVPPEAPQPPPINDGQTLDPSDSEKTNPNALNMVWSFGMNRSVPVINLTDETRKMIMYTCAHTGVIYDVESNSQMLLQGHSNALTCTCVSADKRWLVTADYGPENMVIVWDTYSGTPVRTLFEPNPEGVVAVAMTPDAKYLAVLSAEDTQTLSIWDWTVEAESPLCIANLDPAFGVQNYIHFNPEDTSQIITNSESQVVFYEWGGNDIQYFAPPLSDDDFNKQVGRFSQSIFMRNSTRALTATSVGNLVVWDTNKPLTKVVSNKPSPDKKALKLVKMQDRGLSVLTMTDEFIVAGDVQGHVKFFDQKLKLLNWYQDFHLGPINALSFAFMPEFDQHLLSAGKFPSDATIAARPFVTRDFVVGTTNAIFAHVQTDGTDIMIIHKDHDASVHALASHPDAPRLAVGSYSGLLKIWDYETREVLVSRTFEKGRIRCCAFDPKGNYIAVGFTNGQLRVLDALSLDDLLPDPFRYAKDAITHVAFSHDASFLATADAEHTTTIYRAEPGGSSPYIYIGRYRAHYKLIVDIMFGIMLDSNQPRLLSLGEDRVLVEYDLENTDHDHIQILSSDRIEQSATPLCCTWYPPVTKESFIVTANDQFKFKLYNATTKMCRKTLLGPTYGNPLQKIAVLPTADEVHDKRYMAYITVDKIGLHSLPLDGNPHNAVALIAHPQGVANLVSSFDGKYVFTAGGQDSTVHMWQVNVTALDAQSKLGGDDLIPFYGLLDGGREGELFRELEDYFYYAQLRSQGINTTEARHVKTKIPLTEVPFVMRALGFYPSEQEIEDMLNEVKYSNYVETGEYTNEIDLGEFIKLYINHRPAFGLEPEKLLWAFDVLGVPDQDDQMGIDRGDFLDLLQCKGEHMSEIELAEYLTTLLGFNEEGGSSEQHDFDPATAGDLIDKNLPHDISADMFANKMLGFGMYGDVMSMSGDQNEDQLA